jgi:hypothetical protein
MKVVTAEKKHTVIFSTLFFHFFFRKKRYTNAYRKSDFSKTNLEESLRVFFYFVKNVKKAKKQGQRHHELFFRVFLTFFEKRI